MACGSCFDLPCSGIRLIVSEDSSRLDADTLAVAAMERLRGFGVFVRWTLICPPDSPLPSDEDEKERWTKRTIIYYHHLFFHISRHKASSVALMLWAKSWDHGKLLMDMMAETLTSYTTSSNQRSLKTITVVVQDDAFDYFHICLTTCLKAMAQLGRPLSPSLHTQTTSTTTSGASTSSAPSHTSRLAQRSFGDQLRRIFSSFFQSSHRIKTNGRVPVSSFDRIKGLQRQKLLSQFCLGKELPHPTFGTGVRGERYIYPWGDVFEHPSASQSSVTDGPSSRESSQTSGVVIPVQTPSSRASNSSGFPSSMETGQHEQLYSRIFALCDKADVLLTYHVTGNANHSQGGPLSIVCSHYSQSVRGYWSDVLDFYVTDMPVQAPSDSGNKTRLPRDGKNDDENDDSSRKTSGAAKHINEEDLIEPAQSKEAPTVQTTGSDKEVDVDGDCDNLCVICLDALHRPTKLNKCGHVFCRTCLEQSFQQRPRCPLCNATFAVKSGNMPDGKMEVYGQAKTLPGYEDYHSIVIDYMIPSGLQGRRHPNRGQAFAGTFRRAYLPACEEGVKVCRLLWVAFMFRHTFTVGRSMTTGRDNVVTWNDIHHKTSWSGGPSCFGYPDPGYLRRVTEELAAKGITEEFVKRFKVPF